MPKKAKKKIILDLCGGSGSWSYPWKIRGYDVRLITLPFIDVRTYKPPKEVFGVLAAPPCTEFSNLNCFTDRDDNRNIEGGMELVDACLKIIKYCNPKFWAMENPTGLLRKYIGKPTLTFQPWHYGDPWTKQTDIWGEFSIPSPLYLKWEDVPNKLDLYTRPCRKKPSIAFLHKSAALNIPQFEPFLGYIETDADLRAITPPGFANEFYKANRR